LGVPQHDSLRLLCMPPVYYSSPPTLSGIMLRHPPVLKYAPADLES
jgi:hypothetical protein